jgi:hypothetical protein
VSARSPSSSRCTRTIVGYWRYCRRSRRRALADRAVEEAPHVALETDAARVAGELQAGEGTVADGAGARIQLLPQLVVGQVALHLLGGDDDQPVPRRDLERRALLRDAADEHAAVVQPHLVGREPRGGGQGEDRQEQGTNGGELGRHWRFGFRDGGRARARSGG